MIKFDELKIFIDKTLESIDERDANIFIELQSNTLEKVGIKNGISKERTRQINYKILRKIKNFYFTSIILKHINRDLLTEFTFDKRYTTYDTNFKYMKTLKLLLTDYIFLDSFIVFPMYYYYYKDKIINNFKDNYFIEASEMNKEILKKSKIIFGVYKNYLTKGANGFVLADITMEGITNITDDYVLSQRNNLLCNGRSVRSFLEKRKEISKVSSKIFESKSKIKIHDGDLVFLYKSIMKDNRNTFSKNALKEIFSSVPYYFDLLYYEFKKKYFDEFIFSTGISMSISKIGTIKEKTKIFKIWKYIDWEANFGYTKSIFQFSKVFFKINHGENVLEISEELSNSIRSKMLNFDFSEDIYFYENDFLNYLKIPELINIKEKTGKLPLGIFSKLYDGSTTLRNLQNRIHVIELK